MKCNAHIAVVHLGNKTASFDMWHASLKRGNPIIYLEDGGPGVT